MIIARPRPTQLHRLGLAAFVVVLTSASFVAESGASGPAMQATSDQKVATAAQAPLRTPAAAKPARANAATKPHRVRAMRPAAARPLAAPRDTCGWFWCGPRQVSVLFLGIGF